MKRTALSAVTTICLALSGAYSIAAAQQSSAGAQRSGEDELPVLEAYRLTDGTDVQLDGRIVEMGDRDQIINDPQHDYTKALLSAVPEPDPRRRKKRIRYERTPM